MNCWWTHFGNCIFEMNIPLKWSVSWSMRQFLRNNYILFNPSSWNWSWPARTRIWGRVWFHHQWHLQGCSRSSGFAARLLFCQPSKAAEPLDRLVYMAEWFIPWHEASKPICAAVLDIALLLSMCLWCLYFRGGAVWILRSGWHIGLLWVLSKCCLIIRNQILGRQPSASHI